MSHPKTIGAYSILEFLGEGGMGQVYRAEHRTASQARRQGPVVVKTLHPHLARQPEFRARFEQEAEIGCAIDHPGVVRYLDLVSDRDTVALVLAYVPGQELVDCLDNYSDPEAMLGLLAQLAEILDHLHGLPEPVIHRDLKPSNLRVTPEGRAVLLDFGIAREGASSQTRTGTGMGTVHYMAPEQYTDAKRVDGRADIYALGLIAFRLLTGSLPWDEGASEFHVLTRKAQGELDLSLTGPSQSVFEHALAPRREDRFGKAGAFVAALRSTIGAQGARAPARPAAPAPSARPRAVPRPRPSPVPEPVGRAETPTETPPSPAVDTRPARAPRRRFGLLLGVGLAGGVAVLFAGFFLLCAAIAIPNYVQMQYRAKRSEVLHNVKAIKTAELAHDAEWDAFVACERMPRLAPDANPVTWNLEGSYINDKGEWDTKEAHSWNSIPWFPDGEVRGVYWVTTSNTADASDFTVHGISDVDGDDVQAHYTATKSINATMVTPPDVY